jgi:DNA-binding MarR family transcriptional regulator
MISRYVPFLDKTFQEYHWSINQAEYSTDIIFKNKESLYYIYEQLNRNCILSVKPGNVVTYFDRKLTLGYYGQIGSKYNKSIQGIRIKHYMGANSIKIYNKFPTVLRIETTINSLREIYILRDVLQKNKQVVTKPAIMKKSIYSLFVLSKFCKAANSRYLDFISSFEDNSDGRKNLEKVSEKVTKDDRSYRGFNFFDNLDVQILLSLTSGELNINGFRNKFLRKKLGKTSSAVTRIIKRLLLHHIIKKVNNTYKYHLTKLGRRVLSAGFVVKELKIIPALAA